MEAKTRGSTGKRSASGSAGGKAKKVRRGTFDKSPAKEVAVEATKSSSSLKDEIMAEIDRKVQIQVASKCLQKKAFCNGVRLGQVVKSLC